MTLYLIGLGLHDEKDITVNGLEIVKRCEAVYLETYTSSLSVPIEKLEEYYQKTIIPANREVVEQQAEQTILKDAAEKETAFLVIGDPFGATTHIDLRLRAKELGIPVKVVNNASILNAIGIVGLELYKFGKVTSIPFDNEKVTTPIDVFRKNDEAGLHTLVLFDLDPQNDRYMTMDEALTFLISKGLEEDRLCVGVAGIGSDDPEVFALQASHLKEHDFQKFPRCMIIPSKLHFMEEDALALWKN